MGLVCSALPSDENRSAEFGGNLEKVKNLVNGKGNYHSNPRTIGRGKKLKKRGSGFSKEFKLSTANAARGKQVSQPNSLLERVGDKEVEVVDTLGNSMPTLSPSNGSSPGMAPRRNKISILAFELANTINMGLILFQSLSEENIKLLEREILNSEGMQRLVSTDTKELMSFIEADKREEFNAFSREVARFGNMCKHSRWHNLDRYFSRLDLDVLDKKQPSVEAEKTMQELTTLAKNTAALYHELNAFDRFEQDYKQKVKEMESLDHSLKGESLTIFLSELKHQRKHVKSLQKKSLWSRNLDEIVEKLVFVVTNIHQAISEFLGNYGQLQLQPENKMGSRRLGEAGLALHYANIINQITMIASCPMSLPPYMRDTLYHGLPNNIKGALPSKLQSIDVTKKLSLAKVKGLKDEIDKTLQWLAPFATNTTKAHQGFGWVGEWAKRSYNRTKESKPIRLQTLHYADKQKIDFYILELLALLHHLVSFVRYRNNKNHLMKPIPNRSPPNKRLNFQTKMQQFISLDQRETQLSQVDRSLLVEEVVERRRTPGLSKSEDLAETKKSEARVWYSSKSVGSSTVKEFLGLEHQNTNVLDVIDGLR